MLAAIGGECVSNKALCHDPLLKDLNGNTVGMLQAYSGNLHYKWLHEPTLRNN